MNLRFVLPLLVAVCFSLFGSEPARDYLTTSFISFSELEIQHHDRRILLYEFDTNQFKPYVKELYTLSGQNVLRDAPADHLHHHGLMYAVRVNAVNFWEEVGEPGREHSISVQPQTASGTNASFTQVVEWTANSSRLPLLSERRTISVSINAADGEVAIDWRSNFQVGAAAVKLTGSAYNGLGLRLPESFDRVARHQNSANLPYTAEAKWDVTAAQWSAVTGKVNGSDATVALFEDRANNGETRFFTMLNPFAYLSVTQNLENHPLEYAPGASFSIRYLLTVYPEAKSAAFLNHRLRRWQRSSE